MNAQAFSLDDIIDRHLLILFPFYLMRYDDKRLTAIEADESLTEKLVEECREARRCLEPAAFDMGGDALFRDIIQYAVQVSDKLLAGHENLKGKVRKAMGGDYIETLDEIIERQEAQIKTRDAQIKTKDAQLKTKDAQIKTKDAQIKTKDAQLKTLKRELDAVLSHVAALEHTLASL